MKNFVVTSIFFLLCAAASAQEQQLFNGNDLSGWEGQPGWWTVEDGAITSESTAEKPCPRATYLVWKGGDPADFELTLDFKLSPIHNKSNSGVQIRSERRPNWDTFGYQADMTATGHLTGFVYHHARGLIAARGEQVTISPEGKREAQKLADQEKIQAAFKPGEWNRYRIVCDGPKITLDVNGVRVCEFTDLDAKQAKAKGIIALQMHPGPPMKVQFKNIVLKEFSSATGEQALIGILKSNANAVEKRNACRELTKVGSAAAVPVLSQLLSDEALSHMARRALQTIPGIEADQALQLALSQMKGKMLAEVVYSIGQRDNETTVPALIELLGDGDASVAQAAARALGSIGTAQAVMGLEAVLAESKGGNLAAVSEALLDCASNLDAKAAAAMYDALRAHPSASSSVKSAALRSAILVRGAEGVPLLRESLCSDELWAAQVGAKTALELEVPGIATSVAECMKGRSDERQVMLAGIVGDLADASVLPVLIPMAKDAELPVRLAILQAVTQTGGTAAVAPLMQWMSDAQREVSRAATIGLAGVQGQGVNDALMAMLRQVDVTLQQQLVGIVSQRGMQDALPVLVLLMDSSHSSLRLAAMQAYGELATIDQLPGLLTAMKTRSDLEEINVLGKAIARVCIAAGDPAACGSQISEVLESATPEAQGMLRKVLKRIGG